MDIPCNVERASWNSNTFIIITPLRSVNQMKIDKITYLLISSDRHNNQRKLAFIVTEVKFSPENTNLYRASWLFLYFNSTESNQIFSRVKLDSFPVLEMSYTYMCVENWIYSSILLGFFGSKSADLVEDTSRT